MANEISVRLQGLKAATDKMVGLAPKLRRYGLRKAARQAMNIVRDDAKARARALDDPETAEKVWKNIITQESARQGRREGGVVMKVGVRGGASSNKHNPPAPFMRPAFSTNVNAVTERFVQVFGQEIDAAL